MDELYELVLAGILQNCQTFWTAKVTFISYICMENPGENKTLILLIIWMLRVEENIRQARSY